MIKSITDFKTYVDICANKRYGNCFRVPQIACISGNSLQGFRLRIQVAPQLRFIIDTTTQEHSNTITLGSVRGRDIGRVRSNPCAGSLHSLPAMRDSPECTIFAAEKIEQHRAVFLLKEVLWRLGIQDFDQKLFTGAHLFQLPDSWKESRCSL